MERMTDAIIGAPGHLQLLAQAKKQLEAPFTVYPVIGNGLLCPTGQPYLIIYSGAMRATPEAAIERWLQVAEEFANQYEDTPNGLPWTLYWRTEPEMIEENGGWRVYSRFIVSNKRRILRARGRGMAVEGAHHGPKP